MALIEIDDSELASHRQVTETMQKLLANPKTRNMILRAQKIANPDAVIPELDATEPLRGELEDVRSTLASLTETLAADRAEREKASKMQALEKQWNAGRSKLRNNGYTDEGLEAVEKFMEDKGLADHEIAAAAYERFNPPQEPVRSISNNRFDVFGQEDRSSEHMKSLLADPESPTALDNIINDTLRSIRGR